MTGHIASNLNSNMDIRYFTNPFQDYSKENKNSAIDNNGDHVCIVAEEMIKY